MSPRHPMTAHQACRTTSARHAGAAVHASSSSRCSSAGGSREDRRTRRRRTGRPHHDPAWHGRTFSRRRPAAGIGPARVYRQNRRRQRRNESRAGSAGLHGGATKPPLRIHPHTSQRRSRHRRHRPQIEIPIASTVPRGFLPRGLSYACRRPKLFTRGDCPVQAEKLRKPTFGQRPHPSRSVCPPSAPMAQI